MDNAVSKAAWLGAAIIMMVSVIALAVFIFGVGRKVTNGAINNGTKLLLDANDLEMRELQGSQASLTAPNIIGLVERNDIVELIYYGTPCNPTPEDIRALLKSSHSTTHVVNTERTLNGWKMTIGN